MRVVRMDKKDWWFWMLLKVIFLRPKSLLKNLYKKECEKEKITADDAIFYNFRSKELAWKNILF